ncbi:hypothetical protein INT44_003178 [Umbelopsis vinacea]|uniref:Uncharacterized protein n=1 Tax=Umbelopsis vinacea TaxID=44442 RepID=A0A8H7UKX1_9FUNG|nr:hypothetical protein INT44_003178 [Umbelopsis vinacea]
MNKTFHRAIALLVAFSSLSAALPVSTADKHLQLLARDVASGEGIQLPQGANLKFSLFAEGTQNYTCDSTTHMWTNVGALAHLSNSTLEYDPSKLVGFHYFTEQDGVLSPEWDLSLSEPYDENGNHVIAKKISQYASPDGPENVPWLLVQGIEGDLAKFVTRIITKGGVPRQPNCDPSQSDYLTVPYTSLYMFFD